ncbi:metallo-beta-lactamase domain-containing [Trichoderma arundinaceum]|uniref:Metallo-beta-lactamase domain-containing n=1 Tax=Trichoderma arundinaceum TaxID=490622 RepID=A0A395NQL4_TRIAR|nr:metallo-beta-lactamase domain-containing [Trichoderma arundinaceum]
MARLPPLQVDTFVSPPTKIATGLPEVSKQWWQPETSTLIHGPNNAVLCDPPITIQQCTVLADWIDSVFELYATSTQPKKKLQFIFITHAHGDHFFGTPVLQSRFPGVQIVATDKVTAGLPGQYAPEMYDKLWKVLFPEGQLPEEHVRATALPKTNEFTLDGHILRAYDVSADHIDSSILHVPSLDLVVCGDVVYGDCHQYFVEANTTERRRLWLDALNVVDSLNPKIVVASHKRASQIDGAYLVDATRKYIIDFETLAAESAAANWQTLYHKVKDAYPHRWNDFLLEASCKAYFSIDVLGSHNH